MVESRLALLIATLALVVGVVVAAILSLVGLPIWLAVLIGLAIAAASVAGLRMFAERLALAGLSVRPALDTEFPRLHNLVDSVCLAHGFARPDLLVVDCPARNAAVMGRGDRATFVFTTGLLDDLEVVEQEGVLGHAFHMAMEEDLFSATAAVPLSRVFGTSLTHRSLGGRHRVFRGDLEGVRLTRYPPGLAAALSRVERGSTEVPKVGERQAHLWFVQPYGPASEGSDTHPPIGERVDALREL